MREEYLFNHDWQYAPLENPSENDFEPAILPHTNIELPHDNFDEAEYEFISTYRKTFRLPEPRDGRRVHLQFDGIMTAATVTINEHTFAEQRGGFIPFTYDLTDYLDDDGENTLIVRVDSHERDDIPPHGGRVDYLVFGGIYRDAHLRYVEPTHLENVRVQTDAVLTDTPTVTVRAFIKVADEPGARTVTARLFSLTEDDPVSEMTLETQFNAGQEMVELRATLNKADIQLWSPEHPALYRAEVTLVAADGSLIDQMSVRFGFREAVFKDDGFYLNGEKRFLRGLNRHQLYPYIGAAAPARLQQKDADILKYELACDIVRTSHYPQSPYFLDRCDEIGLLVFEEIPGWQHIGDDDWQNLSLRDVRAMIERDWNHPSIVVWGVRINESWDNADFYTRTNQLARELDPTRQTTGVRFFPTSEFLEDVYSFNDFSNSIIEPTESPWIVTEFNGHMFPTKTYDNEERQMEHARRHADIQSRASMMGGVSGAIGWCAFDYNTHRDFGSGDRICYHGVMDQFREPKWAAAVYASQRSPQERVIMEPATLWTVGDRSGGGNDPLYVYTNCDEVQALIGDDEVGRFQPARDEFPGLDYPPVKIEGFGLEWGGLIEPLTLRGFVGGAAVIEKHLAADGIPRALIVAPDDAELNADGMDMTRLVIRVVDEFGNRLPYAHLPIGFALDGADAKLYGENPFVLVGGQGALYLRAGQEPGDVTIMANAPRLESVTVTIRLV